ncbi:MAG: succinate dehydrogenase, partial [Betaproteobacteria bacterium]|nr:succinate dehydrogenase [Betaproteobacteria bacterium]
RAILSEWVGWRDGSRDLALWVFGAVLAVMGIRAVFGVFG